MSARVLLRYMARGAGRVERLPLCDLPARLKYLAGRGVDARAEDDDGNEVGASWRNDEGARVWYCEPCDICKQEEAAR